MLFSPETLTLSGDLRLVGVDGERSWVDDGFGKLRYDGKSILAHSASFRASAKSM